MVPTSDSHQPNTSQALGGLEWSVDGQWASELPVAASCGARLSAIDHPPTRSCRQMARTIVDATPVRRGSASRSIGVPLQARARAVAGPCQRQDSASTVCDRRLKWIVSGSPTAGLPVTDGTFGARLTPACVAGRYLELISDICTR